MAITRHFKGSTDSYGYGYFGYIEDGQLVLGENWPREGGVIYRGPYEHAGRALEELMTKAPKLYSSITKYYAEEAEKAVAKAAEVGVTYRFKDSRDSRGNGYSGYIKNGKLFLEYDDPRNGGEYFRGSYVDARVHLDHLKSADPILHADIEKYFTKHGVKDETLADLAKKYTFDEATKTVLFKVKLYMDNREVHNVLVRGRSQSGVVEKLMSNIPEVLFLQTWDAKEFAVRSEKISAVEFVED